MDLFETIKSSVGIKQIVEYYIGPLNRAKKVSCPFHKDKTPSLSIDENKNMFKCFSAGCDFAGDGITLVARLKNIDNFEAAKQIAQDFHLNIDIDNLISEHPVMKIKTYIKECIQNVSKTDYFEKRGLDEHTIKAYFLGYDVKEKAVVIPYSSALTYYQRRSIVDKKFYKPKTEEAGEEPLWNAQALNRQDKTPVFIVESPICALSIMQYGGLAVALCGCGYNKLVETLKKKPTNSTIILCLDNDDAGIKTTEKIIKEFKALKIKYLQQNIAGECKDPNELLMKNADALCLNIQKAINKAKAISRERTDLIKASDLCKLEIEPKKWIVDNMIPEGLSMLVAASKIGKSWMVLQLGIAVSSGEEFLNEQTHQSSVLYYALEDSDERMIGRLNILCKEKPKPTNLFIQLETKTLDTGLMEELEHRVKEIPNLKLIIIDTFQMIRGQAKKNETAYSFDYRELVLLRRFCAENHIAILLIHHARKMLDENDVFNMINGSNGVLGALDNAYFIYKKKRTAKEEPSTLTQTGRDVFTIERLIQKSDTEGKWTKVGSPEEEAERRKREKVDNSPVTKTILALLKAQPSGWTGTTRDFIKASLEILGGLYVGTEQEVGREIKDIEIELLRRYNIDHTMKHSNNGNKHSFFPKQKYNLFNYNK